MPSKAEICYSLDGLTIDMVNGYAAEELEIYPKSIRDTPYFLADALYRHFEEAWAKANPQMAQLLKDYEALQFELFESISNFGEDGSDDENVDPDDRPNAFDELDEAEQLALKETPDRTKLLLELAYAHRIESVYAALVSVLREHDLPVPQILIDPYGDDEEDGDE